MGKVYKKLLFDLDNTLVDDDENRKYAITKILLERKEKVSDEIVNKFIEFDNKYWKDRSEGKIKDPYEFKTKEEKIEWVRAERFVRFLNIPLIEAIKINNKYINYLKENIVPIKNSEEILKYLYEKEYEIYIVTNGPIIVINDKLTKINAQKYIKNIFSAEEVGYAKPSKEYFEGFFKKINNSQTEKMLIIGDELEKDVLGGLNNGIDTCWFNSKKIINSKYEINYEINELIELKNIL